MKIHFTIPFSSFVPTSTSHLELQFPSIKISSQEVLALHFQTLHRFLKKKASKKKIEELFYRLKELLYPLLPKEEAIFVLDSTGIPHRGLNQEIKWMRGKLIRKVKGHSRICALISYFRKEKLLFL